MLVENDPPLDVFFVAARGAAPVVETTDDGLTLFWCGPARACLADPDEFILDAAVLGWRRVAAVVLQRALVLARQPPHQPTDLPPTRPRAAARPPLRNINAESPGTYLDEYGSLYLRPHQRMLLPLDSPAVAEGETAQLDGGGSGPGDGSSW